jgi:WD40 repeat protein
MFAAQIPSYAQEPITRIFSLAWSPDGSVLAIGGIFENQRAIRLVDLNGNILHQFDVVSSGGMSWRPDGAQVAAGVATIGIWDTVTGELTLSISRQGAALDNNTYWNPDNFNEIANVEQDRVTIRNAITGEILMSLDGEGGRPDGVLGVGWSQDGARLYTVSEDDVIRVWNTTTGTVINVFPLTYGAGAFVMSPDATKLAIGTRGMVFIHEALNGSVIKELENLPDLSNRASISHLIWRPDGEQVAGVDNIGIHIWDIETGQLLNTIPHLAEDWVLEAVAYSPNGYLTLPDANHSVVLAPIALASSVQTLTDTDNSGSEAVTLDGSASTDPDGTVVSYSWTENDVEIATGVTPTIDLPVGEHTITLTITDDDGLTASDTVAITVERYRLKPG